MGNTMERVVGDIVSYNAASGVCSGVIKEVRGDDYLLEINGKHMIVNEKSIIK